MSDGDEIARAEMAEWLAMRPAAEMREDLRTAVSVANGSLEVACERTTDPIVRGAYENLRVLREMLRRLSE